MVQLAMGWSCYRGGHIGGFDLRVWLACRLEVESRRGLKEGRTPRYGLTDLARRVGAGEKRVRSSLRRLKALGLVSWSPGEIRFATSPEQLRLPDLSAVWEMFNAIPNRKRLLPVPRRILRFMTSGGNPSLIAAVFGHLIRCLYFWPDEGFKASGTCKASWVASVFGISLRSAKAARKGLEALGWLIRGETLQRRMNSFGPDVSINLDWAVRETPPADSQTPPADSQTSAPKEPPAGIQCLRPVAAGGPELSTSSPPAGPEIAPPPADSGAEIAPPRENKTPPPGTNKNQDPACGGKPTGFSISERGGDNPPTLKHVVPEDLRETSRLLELHRQAIAAGLLGSSDNDRLRFVAAAEHARAVGKENPCGLFIHLVRGKLWAFLTQDDEDAANRRLKAHLFGEPRVLPTPTAREMRPAAPPLSADARLVQAVTTAATRAGYRGDPFYLLRREKPEWTRERWDDARRELEARSWGRIGSAAEGHVAGSLQGLLPQAVGALG